MFDNATIWKIIQTYFNENPQAFVSHHVESYNDFFDSGIYQIFKEKNPVQLNAKYDANIQDFRRKCYMYFGGKNGDRIHIGKPVIYDKDPHTGKENPHYMFPNEARLRNMTYGMTIHYDIEFEFEYILEDGEEPYEITTELVEQMGKGLNAPSDIKKMNPTQHIEEYLDDTQDDIEKAAREKNTFFKAKPGEEDDELIRSDEKPGVELTPQMKKHLEEKKKEEEEKADKELEESIQKAGGIPNKKRGKNKEEGAKTTALAGILKEINEESIVNKNIQRHSLTVENIYLGKFPIMVQSKYCILSGLPRDVRFSMGECKNDAGGYFIIDGKEKTVVVQEKFADNMLYVRKYKIADKPEEVQKKDVEQYLYSAEIRSVSENVSKPMRTLSVKMVAPSSKYTNRNIVVNIPNVKQPIPLFIVFRALGVLSDKEIMSMCVLDTEKYETFLDLLVPCVHDAGHIFTQQDALIYIASYTKYYTKTLHALELLTDYFLPHIGETNYIEKAYYLGYMVFRLLSVDIGLEDETNRDNFKYKRIELVGSLIGDLFREYYSLQQRMIRTKFDAILFYNVERYENDLPGLILNNYSDVFREFMTVNDGFKKGFKGAWGAQEHTRRVGVIQDLNRLSFNSALSHLRKTNLPLDSSLKIVGPRLLHNSQWGFIDPIDTPDGGNIGLHKTLAVTTYISRGYSREHIIEWLIENGKLKKLTESSPLLNSTMSKVFVNGYWCGVVEEPLEILEKFRLYRRNGLIPLHTSITYNFRQNTVYIYTDAGRMCRPVFYTHTVNGRKVLSYEISPEISKKIAAGNFTWSQLISGFNPKRESANYYPTTVKLYKLNELYEIPDEGSKNPAELERFLTKKSVIEYIDPSETEDTYIALSTASPEDFVVKPYTHQELHESLTYGTMCNQTIFLENNPLARNSFSCSQSRQACSVYHTNYQVRMDKMAVVLNYGQVPIVKSRYLDIMNKEENPYGVNAMVAIMCYSGYNMEDSVLINEAAIQRGLFLTTYYTTYMLHEETSRVGDVTITKRFMNIENEPNVIGKQKGVDYSKLDEYGIIKEGSIVDEDTILIGMTSNSVNNPAVRIDMSKKPKKGQLGFVDKAFITEGEEGQRIAKVRICEIRIPNIGDKMASRAGQKGTVGIIVSEKDMPYTADGIRPDMIINPHALPSRMTIGHLVECLIGKASVMYGAYSDCTAFNNLGSKIGVYAEMLPTCGAETKGLGETMKANGFHSSGNEIMYNGMTGEQIECDIFFGPNYYMRLKHMVKDKINFRARGPNTALTRQPVAGRANDGGLRIGEMERDVLISHGMSEFTRESMMERADSYYMAVCNTTGMMAIYNPAKNIFMSPMADGPLQFNMTIAEEFAIERITKYGHDFSIVNVPYSFKLLLQELATINVTMRIITEDNIKQLSNLSFSNNIAKLTYDKDMTPTKLVKLMRGKLQESSPEGGGEEEPGEESYQMGKGVYVPDIPTEEDALSKSREDEHIENPKETAHEELIEWLKAQDGNPNPQDTSNKILDIKKKYQDLGYDITGFAVINKEEHEDILTANKNNSNTMVPMINPNSGSANLGYKTRDLSETFKVNDIVYYVGSTKLGLASSSPWTITKIGNKFITIRCNIPMKSNADAIQVVTENEIYYPDNVSNYYGNHMTGGGIPVNPGGLAEIAHGAAATPPPSQNPFAAPVIKIFNGNGNDYSTNNGDTANPNAGIPPGEMHGGGMMGENGIPGNMSASIYSSPVGGGSQKNIQLGNGIGGAGEEFPNKQPKSILGKAAQSFSDFVIKKLG